MSTSHSLLRFFIFTAAIIVAVAQGFAGQPVAASQSQEHVNVIGHLDLHGMQVKDIFLQQREDKSYLFLGRVDKNAFAIVDVTNPAHPVLVDRSGLQEPVGSRVDLPSDESGLAVVFVPDSNSSPTVEPVSSRAVSLPTDSMRLVDLTDPKNPKVVKTFRKVTSVTADEGRQLVFVSNNEGLWIVSHHKTYELPSCTTEAATDPDPQCQ